MSTLTDRLNSGTTLNPVISYDTVDAAFLKANSSFDSANTKLNISGGTITGNLIVLGNTTANILVSNIVTSNVITANTFRTPTGNNKQFLKADGSLDAIDYFHSNNYTITYGTNDGTTTYVYPPSGYTMSNLVGFIPSIRIIYFNGVVDNNDTLYCYYTIRANDIEIVCYNSEQRSTPSNNWFAIWRR